MIRLDALRESDSQVLYGWLSERDYRLQSGGFEHVTWAAHENWFSKVCLDSAQVALGIRREKDDTLVGLVQLVGINQLYRHAELRIRLSPEELGNGYGTEAMRAVCAYGFHDLNLHRIFLHVLKKNTRAIRCYEKVGFQMEGCLREHGFVDGVYEDFAVLGLLSHEFKK